MLAYQAYEGSALRAVIAGMYAQAAIPSNHCRKVTMLHSAIACEHRYHIRRCFSRLKHLRRLASRHDWRTAHFTGFAHAMIWLRLNVDAR